MSDFLDALIRPRAVAIIGASDDAKKNAARPLRYLRRHGYEGRVYPINPRRDSVLGEKAWPGLDALPETVEHAYIVLPTEGALEAAAECAARGVKAVTVLADGFAEAGHEGEERQRRLVETARAAGMRVLGPNSMGVINPVDKTAFTVNAALDTDRLIPGRYMAISQSGSVIGTLLSRGQARGIGFSSLVSIGNEADLSVGEIGAAAVDDPAVDAFLLFLETLRNRDEIARFAAKAHAAGKPIVAYKLGRSDAGRELAVSHTGALVGSDAAADAFFRAHGIVRVDHFETLFEIPPLLIGRKPSTERRLKPVAVVTTTGGGGAMVVDRLGTVGVEVAGANPALRAELESHGIHLPNGRLTDVTLAGAKYETMIRVLRGLLDSGDFSAVIPAIGSSAQFHPDLAVQPIIDCRDHATPLAAFMVPQADESLRRLADAGIAGFRTAESCAEAVRAFVTWRAPRAVAAVAPPRAALPDGTAVLDERRSLELFAALGVPVTASVVLGETDGIPAGLRYPAVAKILSADLPHKTEAGGVELNIADAEALAAARARILERVRSRHPGARIDGLLVQPMAKGLAEVLVGFRRDAEAGPVITLAMGGTLAEIYRDVSVRLAPVDEAEAAEMIEEVKGLAIIRGYRNLPRGDVAALARAVAALSRLAGLPGERVAEAEVNPMIVGREGEGVTAVDGLVRLDA